MIKDTFYKKIAFVFISTSLVIAVLATLHLTNDSGFLKIDRDYSLSELIEFFALIFSSVVLWKLHKQSNKIAYRNLCMFMAYVALDNLMGFHELTGVVVRNLEFIQNISESIEVDAQSVAELLYFGIVGVFFLLIAIGALMEKLSKAEYTKLASVLFGIGIMFAGGVIFDFYRDTKYSRISYEYVGFIEDLIELIGVGFIFIASVAIYLQDRLKISKI